LIKQILIIARQLKFALISIFIKSKSIQNNFTPIDFSNSFLESFIR